MYSEKHLKKKKIQRKTTNPDQGDQKSYEETLKEFGIFNNEKKW